VTRASLLDPERFAHLRGQTCIWLSHCLDVFAELNRTNRSTVKGRLRCDAVHSIAVSYDEEGENEIERTFHLGDILPHGTQDVVAMLSRSSWKTSFHRNMRLVWVGITILPKCEASVHTLPLSRKAEHTHSELALSHRLAADISTSPTATHTPPSQSQRPTPYLNIQLPPSTFLPTKYSNPPQTKGLRNGLTIPCLTITLGLVPS
jgi:hypothetical protein